MEELFFFKEGDKEFRVSWDRDKIKDFQRAYGLEELKIRFTSYNKKRTWLGFFRAIFSEIIGPRIRECAGLYFYSTNTIILFHNIIVSRLFDKFEAETAIEKIVPRVAQVLTHEFGHAEEASRRGDSFLRIPIPFSWKWKMLIPFVGAKYLRQASEIRMKIRKEREDYAVKFAEEHAEELERFIYIEPIL